MSRHKSNEFVPSSTRREWCPYGGGTHADALKEIPVLLRRTMGYMDRHGVKLAHCGQGERHRLHRMDSPKSYCPGRALKDLA